MKRSLIFLLAGSLLLAPSVLASEFDAAQTASREGRWKDALVLWQAASDKYPADAEVAAQVGFAELNTGRLPDAKRTLTRAARLSPSNLLAQSGLVQVAIREHRFDDAVNIASRAARAHPDSADAYRSLGDAQKAASRRSDAEDSYRRATVLGPDDWQNHASLADAVLMRNKADEAVKEYRQAVRLNPNDGALREALGRAAMQGDLYGEAAKCYVDAIDFARKPAPDWERIDRLTLLAIDALGRAAVALRDGDQARQDVFDANTRALTVADALLELPIVADSDPRANPAMAQRATAYALLSQAAAADLAALRKSTGSDAADAAVYREQARRAVVAARAAGLKPVAL
ncbi:MAG TPA: tetratricopeptide repeat protein [Armatimonadota bacterium]|jgi:tetratricopeptide (TPR) repeat protein